MVEFQGMLYLKFDVFVVHDTRIWRKNRTPITERGKTTDRTAHQRGQVQEHKPSCPRSSRAVSDLEELNDT